MRVLIAAVIAVTMATTAVAKQGDYVVVAESKGVGGVYIVNTSDGTIKHCYRSGGEVSCTPVTK